MKLKLLLATASIACLGVATSATAHDDEGWYLRGNAGYGVHTDMDLTGGIVSNQHGNGLQSEGGVTGSLGLGYDLGNNWRLELDGASLWTDFGSISQIPATIAKLRTNTAMLNAIYDFDDFGRWEPYVGAGVGIVQGKVDLAAQDYLSPEPVANPACPGTRLDLVNANPNPSFQPESCYVSDSDTALGYQILAGLGYDINENLKWDTQYRYMDSGALDFDGARRNQIFGTDNAIDVAAANVGAHSIMTGFRYLFGHKHNAVVTPPPPPPPPPPPVQYIDCPDGSRVVSGNSCPVIQPQVTYVDCPDGSVVVAGSTCPVIQQTRYVNCPDGSVVVEGSTCPVIQQVVSNLNVCGSSNVGIFNVNTSATPKQMSRLGTLPEFGDSHGLSADQFYQKLQARYNSSATDKAYLNYLFKSMGYSNGFADAQSYMFSEDVLPVGTAGLLGLGKQHHYNYSILPSNDRDRQAFRIQSANGSVVHFMKTCGNYFYGCE